MPKKNRTAKNKKNKHEDDGDDGAFQNSEDEYASNSESENSESSMSGGEAPEIDPESELDNDTSSLDIDPDDENDPNEDDKYDPIDEFDEPEDTEEELEEAEREDAGGEEAEGEIAEIGEGVGDEEYVAETRQCHLKNLNKDFIVLDEDDSNIYGKMEYKKVPDNDRETDPTMTYYEMVRIIGTRAQQFNLGAEPLVKDVEHLHPAKIAYLELVSKMTPYIIRRHLPGKKYEEWRVDELDIIHEITDDFFVPENFDWESFMKQISNINEKLNETTTEHARIKPENRSTKSSHKKKSGSKNKKSKK